MPTLTERTGMYKELVMVRLPAGTRQRLTVVAGLETARKGKPVTWSQLVRQAINRLLEESAK
jgi:hypothetical protein